MILIPLGKLGQLVGELQKQLQPLAHRQVEKVFPDLGELLRKLF